MTAVARIFINGHPLLVGDILLTGPVVAEKNILIPTSGIVRTYPAADPAPKGLHQKISIIADYLALGWSGPFEVAQDIVMGLRRLCSEKRLGLKELEEYLSKESDDTWAKCEIVGVMIDNDSTVKSF
jgi:hypothetical protein